MAPTDTGPTTVRTPTLGDAIALAARAHAEADQRERNGQPYILHPLRVMGRLDGGDERIVAVLHDTVEDTALTLGDIRAAGFGEGIVVALDAITRRADEDYFDFIERLAPNPIARRVKLADLADNLDLTRIPEPGPEDHERLAKYRRARALLEEAAS